MIGLAAVYQAFERRCRHFNTTTAQAGHLTGKSRDQMVAYVVIELQSALAYVARSSYLAGTVGGWRANGSRMVPLYANATDALLAAAKIVKKNPVSVPGRDEPSWQSADHMVRVANSIQPANQTAFVQATSAYPDVLATMTRCRNFYAHRGADTRAEAETALRTRLALVVSGHLTGVLLSSHGIGVPLLDLWIQNYLDVAELLCER